MKTNHNNDDPKGLCFTIIFLAAAVLTYVGVSACLHPSVSTVWARLIGIPAMLTVWLVPLNTDNDLLLIVTASAGSFVGYFGIGTAILLIAQYLIKKWRTKQGGGGDNRI